MWTISVNKATWLNVFQDYSALVTEKKGFILLPNSKLNYFHHSGSTSQ